MSSTVANNGEASKPLPKKMQECNRCKDAGYPNQMIGFEKIGRNETTGKTIWKLIDEEGNEHKHKFSEQSGSNWSNNVNSYNNNRTNFTYGKPIYRQRKVVDIATVTDIQKARELLSQGWEYKTSYAATISNIPHYILIKRITII